MSVFDYRSTAKWNFHILPIEQVIIKTSTDSVKFDYLLKGSSYSITPIIRARDSYANTQKIIGYLCDLNIEILFNELNDITSTLDTYFAGKKVTVDCYLSGTNAVGMNNWRLIEFPRMNCSFSISKDENNPKISILFSGTLDKNEVNNTGLFLNWVSEQPA